MVWKEEPVAGQFRWEGGESGLVAAMATPDAAVNPVIIKPAMLVTLKVQDTQRRVVARTMRMTDKLQGLMNYYYDTVCSGGTRGAGRFVFDGERLKGEQTPEELGMKSGERIDFFEDLRAADAGGDAAEEKEEDEVVDRKPVIKMHVTVKVQDTAGRTVKRTVWITQKLKVLMDHYYDSVPDVAYGTGKFLYNGRRLDGGQTPAELQMEDEDEDEIEIDFFVDMMGGGGAAAEQLPVPA